MGVLPKWLGVGRRTPLPRPIAGLRAGLRGRTQWQWLHGATGSSGAREVGARDEPETGWWYTIPIPLIFSMVDTYYLPIIYWFVVYLPLWNIWESLGMMNFPIYGKKSCSKPPTRENCWYDDSSYQQFYQNHGEWSGLMGWTSTIFWVESHWTYAVCWFRHVIAYTSKHDFFIRVHSCRSICWGCDK